MNPQKTQLIWLESQQQLDKVTTTDIQLLNASIHPLSALSYGGGGIIKEVLYC